MKIPIICETPGCVREGQPINVIRGIAPVLIDAIFEDYDGSEPEDICTECGEPGIAGDPEPEPEDEAA